MLFSTFAYSLDFQSSRTLSLAKGGRGGAMMTDTITLNPSLLGFQQIASISGTFNWVNIPQTNGQSDQNKLFNVGVVDGKNQYLSAGISFTRRRDADFVHLALAKKITSWFALGVSGKRFATRSNSDAAANKAINGFDGGASASFLIPSPITEKPIQLGLTSDNLHHSSTKESIAGPRQFGAGIKMNIKDMLLLYGDAVENYFHGQGGNPSFSAGMELALGSDFFARAGGFRGRQRGWSVGGGWVGPKVGLSYGYQNTREKADRNFQHAVSMDVYM